MKYYKGSLIFTIICLILAYFWTHFAHAGHELSALFIVCTLGVLEVSFSFDNAVVNAIKLEKMTPVWQHRFLTWGIWIAVFGMRFLFPVLVVSIFSRLGLLKVVDMAFREPMQYAHYLELSHPAIITFGAAFLMMIFFNYFFDSQKEVHWLGFLEKIMAFLGKFKLLGLILTLGMIFYFNRHVALISQNDALKAGLWGVIIYLLVEGISKFLEKKEQGACSNLQNACIVNFLYLELIDASFSLDGVLGAFALSSDVLIIMLGLAIGAMFVRSMTIMFVEKKTLKEYVYLEHGAHWAIGALALIMFISSFREVNEIITGFIGLVFIVCAFICSILKNRTEKAL